MQSDGSSGGSSQPSIDSFLQAGSLNMAFQPIVDLATGRSFAHECLARSRTTDYRNPVQLFESAVAQGKVGELGRACRTISVEADLPTPLFLNLHPSELDDPWLIRPDDPIYSHHLDIYLEVTESVPLTHFKFCHSVLSELRSRGMKLVIDDFGAGYSNLAYISDLLPDVVKLDRMLIAGLDKDVRRQRLLKSFTKLCEDMGAILVAEGIETKEELLAVIDTGCQLGQGYLLGRPSNPAPSVLWPEEIPLTRRTVTA